jgi:hypothetical protein
LPTGLQSAHSQRHWPVDPVDLLGTFEDNKTDKTLNNEELSKKYSLSKGVCVYKQALNDLQKEKNQVFVSAIETREKAQKSLPPLNYLLKY